MSASIRATDGAVLLNGQPFFPVGLYHVSHYDFDDDQRLLDLARMADAGFNVIATPLKISNAVPFLDHAARLGVYVLVENNDVNGQLALATAIKGHPGLLGYQVYDDLGNKRVDANGKDVTYTPQQVLDRHNALKAIDPGALTYGSMAQARAAGTKTNGVCFVEAVDILAAQSYPIPEEHLSATTSAIDTVARASAFYKKSMIANCQAWQDPGGRAPTAAEVRMMAYRSLVVLAKGVVWYAMYSEAVPAKNIPDWSLYESGLWPTMKALAAELNSMAPSLLDGTLR